MDFSSKSNYFGLRSKLLHQLNRISRSQPNRSGRDSASSSNVSSECSTLVDFHIDNYETHSPVDDYRTPVLFDDSIQPVGLEPPKYTLHYEEIDDNPYLEEDECAWSKPRRHLSKPKHSPTLHLSKPKSKIMPITIKRDLINYENQAWI